MAEDKNDIIEEKMHALAEGAGGAGQLSLRAGAALFYLQRLFSVH